MLMYLAGSDSGNANIMLLKAEVENRLTSYFYIKGDKDTSFLKFRNLFIDSGAFTAFTKNATINIDEYLEFCHKLNLQGKNGITFSNLDVIGNPEATDKNWRYMRSEGIDALPVFHYGSDIKFLKRYLEEDKVPYLALGGLVPYAKNKKKLVAWLDYCFSTIKPYFPVKIHLFGITSAWCLERYPIYSSDSTGWLSSGRHGRIVEYKSFALKEVAGKLGDYHRSNHYIQNYLLSIKEYLKLQDNITKLWKSRGIDWEL